jgi:hypothetical protein
MALLALLVCWKALNEVVCMFVILKFSDPMQEKVNEKSDFEIKWEEPKPSSRYVHESFHTHFYLPPPNTYDLPTYPSTICLHTM